MKVKELKEILENYDDDTEILLSSDDDGNSYNFLRDVYETSYIVVNDNIEIGLSELTEELIENGYTEEDVIDDGEFGLILSP